MGIPSLRAKPNVQLAQFGPKGADRGERVGKVGINVAACALVN